MSEENVDQTAGYVSPTAPPLAGKGPLNNVGVSYQQALATYLTSSASGAIAAPLGLSGLGGTVLAGQYPAVPVPAGPAAQRIKDVTAP